MKIYYLFDGYNVMQFSGDLFSSIKALRQQSETEASRNCHSLQPDFLCAQYYNGIKKR